ncbi:peroxisomal succinyl-coenzyme A thioesterase isoform X1 [Gadus morhua]|uniref:Peroxisomal succinyl-coenzyme A thioesterase-like n=2 Tax=Gadus morhua TaxID=8049 RepID=A0A8C4Z629_GADMO|nr:peroxisomal succinyl-coenzyme A thioesterase-like isoform X1 [Gadus morhua]
MARTIAMLSVHPSRGLVDEKFRVEVENLPPACPVTLHCLHRSEDQDHWEAFGHYCSDHSGTVKVSEDESFGGTYSGREHMGLLWSMRPVPGSRRGLRLRKTRVDFPMTLLISVYRGHLTAGFRELPPVASVVAERWYMAPGVKRIAVEERGVTGTFFIPPGPGPFPGVLDMWGGGGGLVEYRSALLASHGFASMALKYIDPGDTPTDMAMGYFETAFQIIQDHPQVTSDRVGILGLSFGTSVALTLAAYSQISRPRCCVGISGSHAYPINRPVAELFGEMGMNEKKMKRDEEDNVIMRNLILPIATDPAKKVDVGRIECPLLLVNGDDDQNWATTESAEDIANMMSVAGNKHLLTTLTYPKAGHLIEPPFTPHIRASNFIVQHSKEKVIMLWGGEPKAHAVAQEDSWKRILNFLKEHLCIEPTLAPQAKL